jgi:hypothetical protein
MPTTVPTDTDLLVAFDRADTELSAGIDAATLSVPVNTGFIFPLASGQATIITIDNERIKVCGRSGNTLTACVGGRGFAGSSASSHVSGRPVTGRVSAWYHNRMRAEVKAIAQQVVTTTSSVAALNAHFYDFTPQTPGTAISPGNNTITVAPVPEGVSGTDANHYLYLFGGTGTAEACLIAGGTAVSGAATGTLILNCAFSHTGSWQLKSATVRSSPKAGTSAALSR